jgi:Flp pilus assembly protein TadG
MTRLLHSTSARSVNSRAARSRQGGQEAFGRSSERGVAMLELALILPLLLLILMGTIEFGRAYNARITLTHATREGARELAVTKEGSQAITATFAAAVSLDPSLLTVDAPDTCESGEPAIVTSEYPFTYSIAFFGSGTITMQSTAVMRCGG